MTKDISQINGDNVCDSTARKSIEELSKNVHLVDESTIQLDSEDKYAISDDWVELTITEPLAQIQEQLEDIDNSIEGIIPNDIVHDASYVHTDNNYTNIDREKLNNLSNYNDTQVKELIASEETRAKSVENEITQALSDIADAWEGI